MMVQTRKTTVQKVEAVRFQGDSNLLPYRFGTTITRSNIQVGTCYLKVGNSQLLCRDGDWIVIDDDGNIYPVANEVFQILFTQETQIDQSVSAFAVRMKAKLLEKADRGDLWSEEPVDYLVSRTREEYEELVDAVRYNVGTEFVFNEAADVGNMAMMVAESYLDKQERKAVENVGTY